MTVYSMHLPKEILADLKTNYLRAHTLFVRELDVTPNGPVRLLFEALKTDGSGGGSICQVGFQYPGPAGEDFSEDLPDHLRASAFALWASLMSAITAMKLEGDMKKKSTVN